MYEYYKEQSLFSFRFFSFTVFFRFFIVFFSLIVCFFYTNANAAEIKNYIEQSTKITSGSARKITFLSEEKIRYQDQSGKVFSLTPAKIRSDNKFLFVIAPSEKQLLIIEKKGSALFVTEAVDGAKKAETSVFSDQALPLSKPADRITPARTQAGFLTTQEFLTSYPYWSSKITLNLYDTLPEKHRNLIMIFPYLRTDLTARFCGARTSGAGVFEALNGQNMSCAELLKRINAIREIPAKLQAFQKNAERERILAKEVVNCSQGMAAVKKCEKVTKTVAKNLHDPKSISDVLR